MKTLKLFFVLISIIFAFSCNSKKTTDKTHASIEINQPNDSTIIGVWKRMTQQGPMKIQFKENGTIETDIGDNNSIDIISNYSLRSDTIKFIDKEGKSCPNAGIYKVYNRGYTVSFDLIDDLCNGRIKSTMGFWVRPNYTEQINQLNSIITKTDDKKYILQRGRMYLALGKSQLAKKDFDLYIKRDSTDAKVYINRAGTRFPNGLKGVIYDCNRAIILDATDKNAYFLRGLAYYGLGEKQKGCNDFQKSIDLGFEILKEAESYKCRDYW